MKVFPTNGGNDNIMVSRSGMNRPDSEDDMRSMGRAQQPASGA